MVYCLDDLVSHVVDVFWDKTIVPIGRQFQYIFCYKSNIANMNSVDHDLENDKKIIEDYVNEASNNLQVITNKANEWLKEVDEAHEQVRRLFTKYEEDQATSISYFGGQILNPITRHHLGRNAAKKKQIIDQLVPKKLEAHEISRAPQPPGIVNEATAAAAQRTHNGVFPSSHWNEAMNKIIKALKDDTTNIIGLQGMGGVGKSTMMDEVHLQVLKQCMFDEVAKVEVKAEVDILRIQEEIASQLGLKFTKSSEAVRAGELRERILLNRNNQKKTVFIILDDLWEKLELGRIGIPSSNDQVQIKLLLTSRNERLLSDKMGVRDPIPLDVLSDVDALRMFKRVLELGVEDRGDKASKAAEIAPKCSGLPVVIVAIANALKNKVLKEWDDTLQRLDVTDVLSKLEVSYEFLPSEESKRLFLLCGIIRGPRIQVSDLLKYTFGLGLYEEKDIHTLEAAATELEKLLSGLEDTSMLLKRDESRYVRIHDSMRDLAIGIVKRNRHDWAHFTLRDDRYEIPRRFDASKLELILAYCEEGGDPLLQIPVDSNFSDMKRLYVLEITNLNAAFSLPSSNGHLRNLETLCLHKCSLRDDISMIGESKGLRVLSFQGSNIRRIPKKLGELPKLKMLDLSDCLELGEIEPDMLGSLTKLEELNMENSFKDWAIDQGDERPPSNAKLIELKNMSRLSNLRIRIPSTSMLPKDDQLFSSKLTMFKIILGDVSDWEIAACQNESKVLMLQLNDSSEVLQKCWVQDTLQRSEVLYLSGSLDGKCESVSDLCINGFEYLKHLRVSNCPLIRYIASSNRGSSLMNLESLSVERLDILETLCNALLRGETFNKLKSIKVRECNKLGHLFGLSLLKCNSELEEISIVLCDDIRWIVIDEDDSKDGVVKLSKLHTLQLFRLFKFSSFCGRQGAQPSAKTLFSGKKVEYPCLESLDIYELNQLEHIWHPIDPPTELGNLRLLKVERCHKLLRVINSNVLMKLNNSLESLSITKCSSIEHVFDVEDDTIVRITKLFLFSRVKELWLSDMERLESICKNLMIGSDCGLTIFPNITSLLVYSCRALRYVLLSSLRTGAGSFQFLKKIGIHRCGKMKAIILVTMMGEETLAIEYSSLKKLEVKECIMLKTFCGNSENMVASNEDNIISASEQVHVGLPFFCNEGIFPCLETIALETLNELRQIWPHEVVAAQRSLYKLKHIKIQNCPKLLAVFPSTLMDCLENLESIRVTSCKLIKRIIVDEQNIRRALTMEAGQQHQPIVQASSNIVEAAMVTTEMVKFTFPCLRELFFYNLPELDRFYSSLSSANLEFPCLETLNIWSCPKVQTLFIQRPPAPSGLVGVDDDLNSNGVGTALFGYCEKQAKSIPSLKFLELWGLISFSGICKMGQSDDCIQKLESLTLKAMPLTWNISISEKKCTIINNDNNLDNEFISFPSLQKLEVTNCAMVKLFGSDSSSNQVQLDNVYIAIEQFLICSDKANPSRLRSLDAAYNNGYAILEIEDQHDMTFGQRTQHLHLNLKHSNTSSPMNLLPLTSPSFCNVLTRLTVNRSDELEYLLTPVGATSLVHLTYLCIGYCHNIKEVVVGEKDEVVNNENGGELGSRGIGGDIREITFNHLRELSLECLSNLESFCSVESLDLNFPYLEVLNIDHCSEMRFFCNGGVLTPKLHEVNTGYDDYEDPEVWQLSENLNTTIRKKYEERKLQSAHPSLSQLH